MRRFVISAAFVLTIASPALANWTASGDFFYQDRTWNNTGFTGTSSEEIRRAIVEIIAKQGGQDLVLATTTTDEFGHFQVAVTDSLTRNVAARVVANTDSTTGLKVKVTNRSGNPSIYAYESATVSGHNPNQNQSFGSTTVNMGSGGEPFNIFDLGVYGAQYIQQLTTAYPSQQLTFRWQGNGPEESSVYEGNGFIGVRKSGGYDDMPILHEWGHYVVAYYSRTTGSAATHSHDQCDEDIDLAFDEGVPSAIAAFVRRAFSLPYANWYIRTTGGSGNGNLDFAVDMEATASVCLTGDENEFNVARCLWDISDDAGTTDDSPGYDDSPPDSLDRPDTEVFNVFTGPIVTTTSRNVNLELFWDGWFALNGTGSKTEMTAIFQANKVDFTQDTYEANDSLAAAKLILPNSGQLHITFFSDPDGDGNGQGTGDTDYLKFNATLNAQYTFQAQNLSCKPMPTLEVLNSVGTVVATDSDPSTTMSWTATATGTFYVRMTHQSGKGFYGSYDLVVTGPVTACGAVTTNCFPSFCFDDNGGNDSCHAGAGSCSNDINTGMITCQDGASTRSCTGNQKVHFHTCPCVCLGSSCGTHVTYYCQ